MLVPNLVLCRYTHLEQTFSHELKRKPRKKGKGKGKKRMGRNGSDSDDSDSNDSDSNYAPNADTHVRKDYPSDWEDLIGEGNYTTGISGAVGLGTIPTDNEKENNGTGRIVAFPNWVQVRACIFETTTAAPQLKSMLAA